jgi:hypothetical protein
MIGFWKSYQKYIYDLANFQPSVLNVLQDFHATQLKECLEKLTELIPVNEGDIMKNQVAFSQIYIFRRLPS